jgi:hypothetical protein
MFRPVWCTVIGTRFGARQASVPMSRDAAGTSAQCHLVFVKSTFCIDCGADPWSAADALVGLRGPGNGWFHWAEGGSRGTRADQGVRPTSHAGFPVLRKISGIGHECLRHGAKLSGSRCEASSRRTSVWILESGMARPFDLFGQTPGFAVALYAQGACHHQGILWRRRLKQAFVPQGSRRRPGGRGSAN